MKLFIYRNSTVESLFRNFDVNFSGYNNVFENDEEANVNIWFYTLSPTINNQQKILEVEDYEIKLDFILKNIDNKKPLIIITVENLFDFVFEESNNKLKEVINTFNNHIYKLAVENSFIKVLNLKEFISSVANTNEIINWKYYYISQNIINPAFGKMFTNWFRKKLNEIGSVRKKCLVLDLDNTLWGGILGEDGNTGIQIGNTYPGSAFLDFQKAILNASQNGVILTICSKNNLNDVLDCWEKNPNMILKNNHFSAMRINWDNKAQNIIEIAKELNIGLDAMVFLDDNPVERERVKQMLPDVTVPDFPVQPYEIISFFKEVYDNHFQIYRLTNEDKAKTNQYLTNSHRSAEKKQFNNEEEYLANLEMDLTVEMISDFNLARLAQMTQKTNQFNLTTIRYSESELLQLQAEKAIITGLTVKDKFGDNGITAMCIIKIDGQKAIIESLLLSCRILGRGIEEAYFKYLLNWLYSKNIRMIEASFIPSLKNKQVENFYEKFGFEIFKINEGKKQYIKDMDSTYVIQKYYNISIN